MRAALQHTVEAWNRFWFTPADGLNLAAARIVIAAHGLWMLLSRDYAAMSGVPLEYWQAAPPGTEWRYLLFPGHPSVEALIQALAIAALVGVLTGVFPRLCALVAGVALYHLAPFEVGMWSQLAYGRGLTLEPLALPILAFSYRARPAPWAWQSRPAPSWEFNWPLKLIQLLVCEIYVFSVFGKLAHTGLAWGSAEHMRNWLLYLNLDPRRAIFHAPGLWLADHPALCLLMGIATMVFELGFIVVLFRPSTRKWLVPIAFLFHAGILVALNIHVGEAWLLLVFIDWTWVRARLFGRPGTDIAAGMVRGPEARLQATAELLRRVHGEIESVLEGRSMEPAIPSNSPIRIRSVPAAQIRTGDIVAIPMGNTLMVHRVVARGRRGAAHEFVVTRGDGHWMVDPPAPVSEVVGVVSAIEIDGAWRAPGPALSPPAGRRLGAGIPLLVFRCALELNVGLALRLGERMKAGWLLQYRCRSGIRYWRSRLAART